MILPDAMSTSWALLDSILVAASVLVLRAAYRWMQDRAIFSRRFALEGDEGDVMTHLVAIDLVRRNGHRIPRETPQFLYSTGFDYPALFHKLLSYVPRHWLERGEWLVSPGFEAVHAALIYLAAWFALVQLGTGAQARPFALIVAAGWAVTPLLTHNPRRGSVLGERCFGYIFGHAYLYCVAAALATGELFWLAPAALVFTIAATSSKFALQAMAFISLALAVIRLDPLPLVMLVASGFAAIVLSLGYVLRVMSGTIHHSRFYRGFLVHVHDYTRSFSTRDLAQGAGLLLRGRWREGKAAFKRHPIHRLPALVPWLFPFALFLALHPGGAPWASALADWVLAAILVTLLTATDRLKFLGEAERYMEFALLPCITLSVLAPAPAGPTLVFAVLVYCLFRLGAIYARATKISSATPETIELVSWFARQPAATVLSIPGRLCYPLLYGTAHRAVWWFINAPRGARLDTWKSLFAGRATYPYVAPEVLGSARTAHNADLIAIDKGGIAAAAQHWGLDYDLKPYRVVFENSRYVVLDAAISARAAA